MSDALRLALWLALLLGGAGGLLALARLGLRMTYARDLLHVGAGAWAFGLSGWRSPAAPLALVAAAAAATALVPLAARRSRLAARIQGGFSGGDERWSGLVYYTLSFLLCTAIGLLSRPFPAAAALLALALGDGIGGFVGRHLGRHGYAVPWGKPKSLEGSLTVAIAAAAGVVAAAQWYGARVSPGAVAGAGAIAALVEALAPRATDNLLIPPAVWLLLYAAT